MQGLELLTDLYELTMMQVYFKTNIINRYAIFDMFFRKNPFGSGYVVLRDWNSLLTICKIFHFQKIV